MKRILTLVVLSLFLCSTASAFQGGGGESTKKKAAPKKKTSGAKTANTTPPRPPVPLARPNTPTITSVTVNSNPPNATVTINGRTAGTTDSNGYLAIGSMKPGVYTVSVTRPGYQPDERVLNLSAGQSETLNFELQPITQSLTISSTPAESEIYIDDVLRGRTDASGNIRLADLPVGEHRIAVRKSRYKEAVISLSLSPDKEGQINASLELAVGFLTVTTNAPNPSIDISGLGHFANPVSKVECQTGTYSVTISSPLYVTSRKEVSVSAGKEAQLSVDLEADTEARNRMASEALEAYSSKQYDRAINVAKTLVAVDAKHPQALTVLAESYFMKDDFNSFTKFGSQAIEEGGSLEIPLRHKHGWGASIMHPVRLVLTAQAISFDPQLAQDVWCSNKPFTVSLEMLGAAEVGGNRENEITLRLVFVDPNKPKKTTTLSFADRESYLVEEAKNTAGGFIRYKGQTMVSRRQAYGAMSFIAGLLNRAKAGMKARSESAMATNNLPEVILDIGGSDSVTGTTATLPTVESIVEANIKALGNPARWTTAILRGTYTWTGSGNSIAGTYEEYLKG
ncbi:MAG: PEGA domain-containing protein, partial [Rubrivivax sp.]|nr:PEGA domain-containing protein [Pyrinomonadaceae bacterium]